MAFYGGSGRGGRDSIDIDFERLFGRGGGNEPPVTFNTPPWIGKAFVFVLGLIVLLFLIGTAAGIYTNYLWFGSLGLSSVYTTRITAQIYTFVLFAAIFLVFLIGNVVVAHRFRHPDTVVPVDDR